MVGTASDDLPIDRSPLDFAAAVGTYVGELLWPDIASNICFDWDVGSL